MAPACCIPKPFFLAPPGTQTTSSVSTSTSAKGVCPIDGTGLRIAVISTRWHDENVLHSLVASCERELVAKGVVSADVVRIQVSGAYELPFAAARVIQTGISPRRLAHLQAVSTGKEGGEGEEEEKDEGGKEAESRTRKHAPCRGGVDAVICIGCMTQSGEDDCGGSAGTMTYQCLAQAVTMGIMKLNVKSDTPVVLGLLTCPDEDQAKRCAAATSSTASGAEGDIAVEWAQDAIHQACLKRTATRPKASTTTPEQSAHCGCSCHCRKCKCRQFASGACPQCSGGEDAKGSKCAGCTCSNCGLSPSSCRCRNCSCAACMSKEKDSTM